MKIGKKKVNIMEYENHNARVIGGLETLAGVALIGMSAFIPEVKDVAIYGYGFGGFAVADGGADLISGRMAYLPVKIIDGVSYVFEKMKNKLGDKE